MKLIYKNSEKRHRELLVKLRWFRQELIKELLFEKWIIGELERLNQAVFGSQRTV